MFSLTDNHEQLDFMGCVSKMASLPCQNPNKFLELLGKYIDLPTLIPRSFYAVYHASKTNKRVYSLESLLSIVLLMHFFKFANVANFAVMLALSPALQSFCRLPSGHCPDESVLSKFKITFEDELRLFFESLSLVVMDIFDDHDAALPDNSPGKGMNNTLIYDSTGLKPKVKENNPKTLSSEIKRQTRFKHYLDKQGTNKGFNVYSAAFKNMPKHALANDAIKLDYANGHFGYFYKFGLVTNGWGVPLHIHFLDKDFYAPLPHDFDSPEEQKYTFDNASLHPVLSSFYGRIGKRRFNTFLGDSEFDSYDNYGFLKELGFNKMLIPLNNRNSSVAGDPIPRNAENIPVCPKDHDQTFIYGGKCKGKNRSLRYKYICPKASFFDKKWVSDCDDMCRSSKSAVTTYTYPSENLRTHPGILRATDEWNNLYKRRTAIEREFSSMKSHPALERPNSYNCASIRADVYLNASAKLLTVILAFALGKPSYIRNLKKLLLAA